MRIAFLTLLLVSPALAALDIPGIEQASGAKGLWNDNEKVYKLTFPRGEHASWACFQSGHEQPALMIAQFELLSDEINPAIDAALSSNLSVTALSQTSLTDEPRVFRLCINGEGEARALASGVRKIRDAVTAARSQARPNPLDASSAGNPAPLREIFGDALQQTSTGYRITISRDATMPCGCHVATEMGFASTANFRGSDDHAAVSGEMACVYTDMQAVIGALRAGNINIAAIGNHTDGEVPRMIFVQFEGTGRANDLAKAVKSALDAQKRSPLSEEQQHQHHH